MADAKKKQSPARFLLVLLFLIPGLFLYFGIDSAIYRYDMRSAAQEMQATVAEVREETYTYRDSDGDTRTGRRVAYDLVLNVSGEDMRRPLLEGSFDPQDFWHSPDMIPPSDYPVGAKMDVLVRTDLNYATVIDGFWSAYVLPVVLIVFGLFWGIGFTVVVPMMMRDWGRSAR